MVTHPPDTAGTSASPTSLLLVVAPFEENAKRAESRLRNAGQKVRAIWVSEMGELQQHLQRNPPDLVLAADYSVQMPLKAVVDVCRRFAPNLPILALTQQLSSEGVSSAVTIGARDLVADGDPDSLDHFERVYVRELTAYRHLRDLARTRAQLADYESRYAQLIAGTGDAVAHIFEGIVSQANPAFAALLGYEDIAALAGVPLMDLVDSEHHGRVKDQLRLIQNGRATGKTLECSLLTRNHNQVSVCAQMTSGEVEGERLIEMLIRAPSTRPSGPVGETSGRLGFFDALAEPPATHQPRAAIFVVVDAFRALEDRVGFDDAERVVTQVAAALRAHLAPGDGCFRFSTQEFALLVARPDALEFDKLAETLVRSLGIQVFSTTDHESHVTLTATLFPFGNGETAAQIIGEIAHEARKLSERGGNRVQVLGSTARANAEEREDQRKGEAVRKAIESNRLKLAYQTIASLEGDSRQHFDVLARMITETGEEFHAADFIRSAEKAGLMRSLDRWVVGRVVRVIATRESRKDNSMLFVKLSEDSLKDAESFLHWLHDTLKGRPLGEEEICFEVQELVLQNHIRKAKVLTKVLRDSGASVAIEHFGIGANSAQLIEHLPINFLKFHSSFTHNFGEKDIQKKMSALMEMAKQRRIKTIVSHVEDANVMARMWQMGVNYIQGYHIQEPEVVMLSEELTLK